MLDCISRPLLGCFRVNIILTRFFVTLDDQSSSKDETLTCTVVHGGCAYVHKQKVSLTMLDYISRPFSGCFRVNSILTRFFVTLSDQSSSNDETSTCTVVHGGYTYAYKQRIR